ncbi:MAG: glycosyltransferase family 2 protein [Desulfobacteraceae bacterium]|nr:glycosyltransferase family 2 protein [Desulfobacteraceae bacterium]
MSIVVPLFNEEDNVQALIGRIVGGVGPCGQDFEIIAVDDGSTDLTFSRLCQAQEQVSALRVIKFRRNFGQTQAMQAGIDHARGEVIVTMDGDLQNDPADIPNLLAKIAEGYDVVSGWRRKRKDNVLRCIPSRVANRLLAFVTGVKIHDNGCSLKAYRASVIKKVQLYSEMHRFIPAFAFLRGGRVAELEVRHHPRVHGRSKYGFSRIWKVFFDLFVLRLVLNFSERPLIWFGSFAFASLLAALALALWLAWNWQATIVWPGVLLLLTFNGFVFLLYGIIGELTARLAFRPVAKEDLHD